MKRRFFTELAYVLGIVFLALGTVLMEKADLGMSMVVAPLSCDGWLLRILFYALGMLICAVGISLFFHTYISPEVYELWVKEISAKQQWDIKSFAFFGLWNFEGVKIGTIVSASLNGFLIGKMTALFERFFEFKDGLPFRKYFES